MTGQVRVGLLGEFGIGNFGNEASLAAVLELLSTDARVAPVVISDRTDVVTSDHGVPALPLHHPRAPRRSVAGVLGKVFDAAHALLTVRSLDAVVVPGTGIFEGLAIRPGGIPLTLFWYSLAARVLRRPFLVLSVGVDHAADALTARLHRSTLAHASRLTVRDAGSADAVTSLGVAPRPRVVPDLVLGSGSGAPRAGGRPTVAVGVIDYRGLGVPDDPADRAQYVDRTVALVARILDAGFDVRVVGGALPDAAAVHEVAAQAAAGLADGRVDAPAISSLDGVRGAMAGCSAVVAVRYHNLIAALQLGLPVVSLGYGSKQAWLLEQFGQGDRVHSVRDFSPAEVAAQVIAAARSDAVTAAELLGEARSAIQHQGKAVMEILGSLHDSRRRRRR